MSIASPPPSRGKNLANLARPLEPSSQRHIYTEPQSVTPRLDMPDFEDGSAINNYHGPVFNFYGPTDTIRRSPDSSPCTISLTLPPKRGGSDKGNTYVVEFGKPREQCPESNPRANEVHFGPPPENNLPPQTATCMVNASRIPPPDLDDHSTDTSEEKMLQVYKIPTTSRTLHGWKKQTNGQRRVPTTTIVVTDYDEEQNSQSASPSVTSASCIDSPVSEATLLNPPHQTHPHPAHTKPTHNASVNNSDKKPQTNKVRNFVNFLRRCMTPKTQRRKNVNDKLHPPLLHIKTQAESPPHSVPSQHMSPPPSPQQRPKLRRVPVPRVSQEKIIPELHSQPSEENKSDVVDDPSSAKLESPWAITEEIPNTPSPSDSLNATLQGTPEGTKPSDYQDAGSLKNPQPSEEKVDSQSNHSVSTQDSIDPSTLQRPSSPLGFHPHPLRRERSFRPRPRSRPPRVSEEKDDDSSANPENPNSTTEAEHHPDVPVEATQSTEIESNALEIDSLASEVPEEVDPSNDELDVNEQTQDPETYQESITCHPNHPRSIHAVLDDLIDPRTMQRPFSSLGFYPRLPLVEEAEEDESESEHVEFVWPADIGSTGDALEEDGHQVKGSRRRAPNALGHGLDSALLDIPENAVPSDSEDDVEDEHQAAPNGLDSTLSDIPANSVPSDSEDDALVSGMRGTPVSAKDVPLPPSVEVSDADAGIEEEEEEPKEGWDADDEEEDDDADDSPFHDPDAGIEEEEEELDTHGDFPNSSEIMEELSALLPKDWVLDTKDIRLKTPVSDLDCLIVLKFCPVEELEIALNESFAGREDDEHSELYGFLLEKGVVAPRLRRLKITTSVDPRHLLNALEAPALRDLKLTWKCRQD